MSTNIPAVQKNAIEHGVLIDLTLDDTIYYISNCYKNVVHNGNEYLALAGFLNTSDIQNNITNANNEIQISLSAIPPAYIAATIGQPIKGGEVNVYRAFFDYNTQEIITGEVYRRFAGIISNFSVQEDLNFDADTPEVTHTITIVAASIMGVLENKISGRRTNKQDFELVWPELGNNPADPSMERVEALFNSSFDFGKKYVAQNASTINGSGGSRETDTISGREVR